LDGVKKAGRIEEILTSCLNRGPGAGDRFKSKMEADLFNKEMGKKNKKTKKRRIKNSGGWI